MNSFTKFLILMIAMFVWISPAAFGQATSITREEFDKETGDALKTAKTTFPRRETFELPRLKERRVREFLAKDRMRYESKKVTAEFSLETKRMQIGADCYELKKEKWVKDEFGCESRSGMGSGTGSGIVSDSEGWTKEEFFVGKDLLASKPVKVFRSVETGKTPSGGEPPYIVEYLYYLDSAGRLLKTEYLTRRGEGKATLQSFTVYEYDAEIAPINPPAEQKNR